MNPLPNQHNGNGKRNKVTGYVLLLFLLAGIIAYAIWWFVFRNHERTPDAYVGGNMVTVTSRVPGSVIAYYADDTDYVEEGQLLVSLDPTDYLLAFETKKSALALVVREVAQLFRAVEEKTAEVALRKALFLKSRFDFENRSHLVASEAISEQDFYHAKADYHAAHAALEEARYQLQAAQIALGATRLENHPLIESAKCALREAYLHLQRCSIYAPVNGYVAKRGVEAGESILPQTPLLSVLPLEGIWIDGNYKETQLADIRIGQPVEVTSDMYGDAVVFHGIVGGIQGGTGSVFSLLPPQNATGNWIKIVQRVPVRIYLDPEEVKEHPLFLGLSVYTKVTTEDTQGKRLATEKKTLPLMKTSVFDVNFECLDAMIEEIIQKNS